MAGLEVEKVEKKSGDTILELEITPNRSDCLSILGMARETAAILNRPRAFPKVKKHAWPKQKCVINIEDKKDCSRYIGTVIEGIHIKKADTKVIKFLTSLDMRPINNVVDITNFCLVETGQPLHAFDFDKLVGGCIEVRRAKAGEKIITLDDVERVLDPSILVIADEKRPVAIAGIMGGKDTEVTNKTKNILLESAYFDPVLIRRASRKLGLGSDSSYRFERGVDYAMVENGASRAVDLILASTVGTVTKRHDVAKTKRVASRRAISITADQINGYMGTSIKASEYKCILKRLDFHVASSSAGRFKVTPPSFRSDVSEAVDIIEEISRIIGYDNLPMSIPEVKSAQIFQNKGRDTRARIRCQLISQGLSEVITYTMINRKSLALSCQEALPTVTVFNPLTIDQEVMRPSMLPGLLAIVLANVNRGQKNIKFFELGKIYTPQGEKDSLAIVMTGIRTNDWRETGSEEVDFYDLKGVMEFMIQRMNVSPSDICFKAEPEEWFCPGQSSGIYLFGKRIGSAGVIGDDVLERWGFKGRKIVFAQVNVEAVYHKGLSVKRYKPISEFPSICRDISLAVKEDVTAQAITEVIWTIASNNDHIALSDVKFIELYQGDKIPEGRRGMVFSLIYQSKKARTLRDDEVSQVHQKICDALINTLGAIQR